MLQFNQFCDILYMGFIIISRFNYDTSKAIDRLTLNIHYLCENYYTRMHMGDKKSF